MLHHDPRYRYCTRVGKSVRVCRSEQECRGEFGCTKSICPLEDAFGLEAFDQRMREFATIFDLWPLSQMAVADFP
jgi:hypothetical protein